MLQHFFKRLLRMTEHKAIHPAGQQHSLRLDGACPESEHPKGEFLAQMLRSVRAKRHAESRGGGTAPQSPANLPSDTVGQDTDQPDRKVVRLTPRQPRPERLPDQPEGDDDPGLSAA